MNIAENISVNILVLKNATKTSLETLAAETQLGKSKLKGIMYLKQSPKINEIEAIATFFGLSPIDLMTKKL